MLELLVYYSIHPRDSSPRIWVEGKIIHNLVLILREGSKILRQERPEIPYYDRTSTFMIQKDVTTSIANDMTEIAEELCSGQDIVVFLKSDLKPKRWRRWKALFFQLIQQYKGHCVMFVVAMHLAPFFGSTY